MNSNPSVHEYFGLKAETMEPQSPTVSEKEFLVNFMMDAQDKIMPYDQRIDQLSREYAELDSHLAELKKTPYKGIIHSFRMAWKEMRLEARMRKNREINILVHEERLRVYQGDYSKFKNNGTRIYGSKFDS
jgi:hypothetical protein